MDLELRHLRTICAIADTGSISQAAVALGVSQPAITLLLRRMEQSIGGTLFQRDRTGSRPTALGERAVRQARLVLAELESFAADLTDPATATVPPPRIGSAHLTCIGDIVDGLEKALPHSGFTLRVEPSTLVLAQLLGHGHLDLAVVVMLEDQQVALPPQVAQRTLVPRLPIFLALAASDPRSQAPTVYLADLRDDTWICPPGADDGSLASLREGCRREGFTPRIRFEMPSGSGRQLIEAGHAIQLVEPGAIATDTVAVRPLAGDPFTARMILAWHRRKFTESSVRAVYQAIADAYSTHANITPHYAPWWHAHPEVHPLTV